MEGKWWGETLANLVNRPWFARLKLSKLILIINNLLADLLIHQMLETSEFAKIFPRQTFPSYGILNALLEYIKLSTAYTVYWMFY